MAMNEKESQISSEIKKLSPDSEVTVKLGEGTCDIDVKTESDIRPRDIVPIVGRVAGFKTKPKINIHK